MEFIADHPDVFTYLFLVIIEQVLLLFPGSWPYRFGIPVRFKALALSLDEVKDRLVGLPLWFHYKVDVSSREIFLRNVFPLWTWGPLLFTAQAQFEDGGRVIIRMAPLTSLGAMYLFLDGIGTFQFQGLAAALLMALLLAWYYRWLSVKLRVLL